MGNVTTTVRLTLKKGVFWHLKEREINQFPLNNHIPVQPPTAQEYNP